MLGLIRASVESVAQVLGIGIGRSDDMRASLVLDGVE
jgi:hypothetical protein